MARCRKSYEEQLNAIEGQITKVQDKLNILLEQRESVLAKKREDELAELYQVLQDNNLTAEDVMDMILGEHDQDQTA